MFNAFEQRSEIQPITIDYSSFFVYICVRARALFFRRSFLLSHYLGWFQVVFTVCVARRTAHGVDWKQTSTDCDAYDYIHLCIHLYVFMLKTFEQFVCVWASRTLKVMRMVCKMQRAKFPYAKQPAKFQSLDESETCAFFMHSNSFERVVIHFVRL